jgi:hypothetical protein
MAMKWSLRYSMSLDSCSVSSLPLAYNRMIPGTHTREGPGISSRYLNNITFYATFLGLGTSSLNFGDFLNGHSYAI